MALRFGTGGIPLTTKKKNAVEGVKRIKELGLDSMELEFVYQVFLNEIEAKKLKKIADEEDVALSVHGSYYINLASSEAQKWHASINRLLDSAKVGDMAGARFVTFHPAFRQSRSEEAVYKLVKKAMAEVFKESRKSKLKIKITPELTGKASQWGDLEELVKLIQDFSGENIGFCFDFAHKHARDGGGYNTRKEFQNMLGFIKKELGQKFLSDMHIHMSGINYSSKGERNHLTLLGDFDKYEKEGIHVEGIEKYYDELREKGRIGPPDLKWKELLETIKEYKVGGIVVCESPNLEHDALLMKKYYKSL